jgi:hypothetical protein
MAFIVVRDMDMVPGVSTRRPVITAARPRATSITAIADRTEIRDLFVTSLALLPDFSHQAKGVAGLVTI